ncbi:MAG TPA: protein translocase subunit SecF, partial [Bdellovibrionota bacterium]|nr:protein translocase subunit SecF [Bdellovibrionota bacterium]
MSKPFFEMIPSGTNINFVSKFNAMFVASTAVMVLCFATMFIRGFNYGVDFRGGTEVHVRFEPNTKADHVREALKPIGLGSAMVQGFGEEGSGEFLVRVEPTKVNLEQFKGKVGAALNTVAGEAAPAKVRWAEDRLYVTYSKDVATDQIKSAVENLAIKELTIASVNLFGRASDHEYLVQFSGISGQMIRAFEASFGKGKFEVLQVEQVGPKVGGELRMQALGAVLISLLFILIYVWFRFEFEFAPGAVISLIHDAVFILGVFSFFQLEVDLSVVACVLTIVGYSINDTIVLYDRVRENLRKSPNPNLVGVINESINQVLARTIIL